MSSPENQDQDAIQALGDFFDEAPPPGQPGVSAGTGSSAAPARSTRFPIADASATSTPLARAKSIPAASAAPHGEAPPKPAASAPAPGLSRGNGLAGQAAGSPGEGNDEVVAPERPARPKRECPPPRQWCCKAGKTIFQEDESSFDLFILEEGKVEILVAEERVAVVDRPGAFLGEIGALLRRPRSAAVRALTPCTFTIYQDFESLMHHDPGKLLEIARTLGQRLADTNDKIEKVFGILYQAKVKEEVIDNVALAWQGKKPKPNQKQKGFWAKLGF